MASLITYSLLFLCQRTTSTSRGVTATWENRSSLLCRQWPKIVCPLDILSSLCCSSTIHGTHLAHDLQCPELYVTLEWILKRTSKRYILVRPLILSCRSNSSSRYCCQISALLLDTRFTTPLIITHIYAAILEALMSLNNISLAHFCKSVNQKNLDELRHLIIRSQNLITARNRQLAEVEDFAEVVICFCRKADYQIPSIFSPEATTT